MSGQLNLALPSGGSVTVAAPDSALDTTVTLPAGNNTLGIQGPAFSAYNSGYQTISTGTWTKINCDTENFDTNSIFASSRCTPNVPGYYQFNGVVFGSASPTGFVGASIYKNGSKAWNGNFIPNSNQSPAVSVSCILYANGSTDYFELYFYQNSGGNMSAGAGDSAAGFNGCLVRAA